MKKDFLVSPAFNNKIDKRIANYTGFLNLVKNKISLFVKFTPAKQKWLFQAILSKIQFLLSHLMNELSTGWEFFFIFIDLKQTKRRRSPVFV